MTVIKGPDSKFSYSVAATGGNRILMYHNSGIKSRIYFLDVDFTNQPRLPDSGLFNFGPSQ